MSALKKSRTIAWDVSIHALPDAFERYLVGMADLYEVSGVSDDDRANFYNVTQTTLSNMGAIGTGRSVRQTLARTTAVLRRSDVDGLNLLINRAAVVGDCDGRQVRAEPGALQFRDMSSPSTSRLDGVDVMTLLVPRHLVAATLLRSDVHGLVLSPTEPGIRLVAAQMSILTDLAETLTEGELETGIQALMLVAGHLAGVAVACDGSGLASLQGMVRRAAADYIEDRVLATDLPVNIDSVARLTGVSRATLYRAFDGEGGVNRYIQDRRLHHARRMLRRRRGSSPSIADIAHRYGFASPNHFSRLFRARYSYSPSDVGPRNPVPEVAMTAGPMRHDILADWIRELALGAKLTKSHGTLPGLED